MYRYLSHLFDLFLSLLRQYHKLSLFMCMNFRIRKLFLRGQTFQNNRRHVPIKLFKFRISFIPSVWIRKIFNANLRKALASLPRVRISTCFIE